MFYKKVSVMRNILFKFKAMLSLINNRFPVRSENLTECKSAFRIVRFCLKATFLFTKH